MPPASFTHLEDGESVGLVGPAWCYDAQANAILITAPEREKERCELKIELELEKERAKYGLRISNLELRIETLQEEHRSVITIKDEELERLEKIALDRPTSKAFWAASGGFVAGVLVTIGIVMAVR
jgi:hypothetical protein